MTSYRLALILIFGLGHPSREPIDAAKGVQLKSRIPCRGHTNPQDELNLQTTFPSGAWAREFVLSRFHKESCEVNVKIKCLHKEKAGWSPVWSATSAESSGKALLSLASCYAWGANEPAQYVLTGWYKNGAPNSKLEWQQATIKQVSSNPEIYEFSDPGGGTARLEISRR